MFFLLQEHSKHPRELVITPKASTLIFVLGVDQLMATGKLDTIRGGPVLFVLHHIN